MVLISGVKMTVSGDYRIGQNFRGFAIFVDAVNVTPNVHNYKKIIASKIFEV